MNASNNFLFSVCIGYTITFNNLLFFVVSENIIHSLILSFKSFLVLTEIHSRSSNNWKLILLLSIITQIVSICKYITSNHIRLNHITSNHFKLYQIMYNKANHVQYCQINGIYKNMVNTIIIK